MTVSAVHAQTSAGSNRVVSPTTVAYWQQHDNGDGTGSLDLLVLWRGTAGWFMGGSGSASGGGRGGFADWHITRTMRYGDISLAIEFESSSKDFDPAMTTATILDRKISLRDTNVVLIDGADAGSPTIVATRYIDPQFTERDPVAAVVKRAPERFEVLRCDITLPDPNQQAMMALLCGQLRP